MSTRRPLGEITKDAEFFARSAGIAMRVPAATDAAEAAALLAEAASVMGADAAAFASFIKDDEAYGSYRFILACDATWCMEYETGAFYMHDPWLEYVRHRTEPVVARHIPARTAREREVVDLARRYGFASAVVIPAQAPQGLTRLGALCIGSDDPGYFDDECLPAVTVAATALALRLNEWLIAQLRQDLLQNTRCSDEDLVLLREERQGRRSKHVAVLLNTTPMSIDSRWQRINARFGVSTRQAAARLAAEYGLI